MPDEIAWREWSSIPLGIVTRGMREANSDRAVTWMLTAVVCDLRHEGAAVRSLPGMLVRPLVRRPVLLARAVSAFRAWLDARWRSRPGAIPLSDLVVHRRHLGPELVADATTPWRNTRERLRTWAVAERGGCSVGEAGLSRLLSFHHPWHRLFQPGSADSVPPPRSGGGRGRRGDGGAPCLAVSLFLALKQSEWVQGHPHLGEHQRRVARFVIDVVGETIAAGKDHIRDVGGSVRAAARAARENGDYDLAIRALDVAVQGWKAHRRRLGFEAFLLPDLDAPPEMTLELEDVGATSLWQHQGYALTDALLVSWLRSQRGAAFIEQVLGAHCDGFRFLMVPPDAKGSGGRWGDWADFSALRQRDFRRLITLGAAAGSDERGTRKVCVFGQFRRRDLGRRSRIWGMASHVPREANSMVAGELAPSSS